MEQINFYINMVRRSWWVVVLCTLGALSVALMLVYNETALYRTSARFIITPHPDLELNQEISAMNPLDDETVPGTFAEILNSGLIYNAAADRLQMDDGMRGDYTRRAVVLPQARVLELFVDGPDPEVAARLTNAIGEEAIEYINERYDIYQTSFLDEAEAPGSPYSPAPKRTAAVALLLGLVVGTGIAFLREQLRVFLGTGRQNYPAESLDFDDQAIVGR
jgi:uncharacterized protein involved in exopolysaccharide biosynthesis